MEDNASTSSDSSSEEEVSNVSLMADSMDDSSTIEEIEEEGTNLNGIAVFEIRTRARVSILSHFESVTTVGNQIEFHLNALSGLDLARSQGDEHAVINHQNKHSVSVNIPFSCEEVQLDNTIRVLYSGENDFSSQSTTIDSKPPLPSQSMSNGSVHPEATNTINFTNHESIKNLNDKRIGFLKTWSSKLW
ncbi:hypothetical protein JHK86_010074 [Glycine max]|nr:hypothetical protein JHK86_010074 [Glycine max]